MDRRNFFTKKIMKKINKDNFKKTLSAFATGITVVATKYNSVLYGKTINSFSSLSLSPPLVLFSLDNNSSKLNIFKKCETITINILSKKQKLVSSNFAKKNPDWKDVDYYSIENGNPIIKNCVSNLDCKIIDKIKKGDHLIFICQVSKVINNDNLKPLIYYNSKYI